MAYRMKGFPKIEGTKGKNYESSKGDQQGPIPEKNIKLQKSENPDTYVYEGKNISNRISMLEDRKSFIEQDEFNKGKSTKQQKKDKETLEREAEIIRDRSKNKAGKKSYYSN